MRSMRIVRGIGWPGIKNQVDVICDWDRGLGSRMKRMEGWPRRMGDFFEWNKVAIMMWIGERDHGWSGWRDGRGGWVIFSRVE